MNGLEIKDLNVKIGNFELKNINLSVPQGTILGLVGKNGAGKTTLIKAISNVYKKTSGTILVNGLSILDSELDYMSELGVAYDGLSISRYIKVFKIIKVLKKSMPNFNAEFFENNLVKFGIDLKKKLVHQSFGTNRKFSIILAMSLKAKVLILDEPTAGIDPADKVSIIELLQNFLSDETNSIIYSTHIISDLEKVADYIALIDEGKIKFVKDKNELLDSAYLVRLTEEQLTPELKSSFLGMKRDAFWY